MKRKIAILFLMLVITISVSSNVWAGRKKYFKTYMKNVKTIAVLPLDYELIVPQAMGSKKQRKGFSEEETQEKRELRIAQFAEKLKKRVEKKGYKFIYVGSENEDIVNNLIEKIKDMRKRLQDDLGDKKEERIIIADEIGEEAKKINEIINSDVFLVPLCRDRMATGAEAITRSFGVLGFVAGGESWKDEYAGHVPWATYSYVHAFLIDSKTFEVLYLLPAISRESMYKNKSAVGGLANGLAGRLPKKKRK
jgi:hypothetical protein